MYQQFAQKEFEGFVASPAKVKKVSWDTKSFYCYRPTVKVESK